LCKEVPQPVAIAIAKSGDSLHSLTQQIYSPTFRVIVAQLHVLVGVANVQYVVRDVQAERVEINFVTILLKSCLLSRMRCRSRICRSKKLDPLFRQVVHVK
jgi:hypothetical protein